jgi:gluconokinase
VIAGVAGSGKSTVGRATAQLLGWPFLDGDDLHTAAARAAMAAGTPLGDPERDLWIARVSGVMTEHRDVVVACSALRRRHRRQLLAVGGVQMFFLDVPADQLLRRLEARSPHFFPPGLLASQIATLEPVQPDEGIIVIDGDQPVADVAEQILAAVRPRRTDVR